MAANFKRIFLNENVWISIKISLMYVPKGPMNNNPALVQIMAWCRPGDKPLSEPMVIILPTHVWVTRTQWVNYLFFTGTDCLHASETTCWGNGQINQEIRQEIYEVRDLFPWEMFTKMVISCLLNVEKIWNSAQIKLDFKLLMKICFRRNNIHWEIDQWNRRRFGAKLLVTVPNSVAPIKPIVCKLIYMSQGLCCQITHKLLVCSIFIRIFAKLWFWAIFIKFMTKNAVFLSFSTTRV